MGVGLERKRERNKMKLLDFLPEMADAMKHEYDEAEKRWGDTWLKRTRAGQDDRFIAWITNKIDQYKNAGTPIPYLSIACDCMIQWLRNKHPEIWPE